MNRYCGWQGLSGFLHGCIALQEEQLTDSQQQRVDEHFISAFQHRGSWNALKISSERPRFISCAAFVPTRWHVHMFERYSCFFLLLWKQKHILSHAGLTPSRWMLPIEARRTKMTRTLAPELPAECGAQQPAPLVPELLQYLLYSLAREQKCARTDCDKGFRQAGDSSISHYLARLVGVWWRGGGFAPSLHDKPLDVYPLQLISHSQQIRHIRCCFGRGHQSG